MSKSGWYKGKRTYWHWYDNDKSWSICGSTPLRVVDMLRYSRDLPKLPAAPKWFDRICCHCLRMLGK